MANNKCSQLSDKEKKNLALAIEKFESCIAEELIPKFLELLIPPDNNFVREKYNGIDKLTPEILKKFYHVRFSTPLIFQGGIRELNKPHNRRIKKLLSTIDEFRETFLVKRKNRPFVVVRVRIYIDDTLAGYFLKFDRATGKRVFYKPLIDTLKRVFLNRKYMFFEKDIDVFFYIKVVFVKDLAVKEGGLVLKTQCQQSIEQEEDRTHLSSSTKYRYRIGDIWREVNRTKKKRTES